MKLKIYGAGSIGNHVAHAARSLGWEVTVCDIDRAALRRMKEQIYPARYGSWDENIGLFHNDDAPRTGFDMIFIGTPPESHLPLALAALGEEPDAILIEKPLTVPSLRDANALYEQSNKSRTSLFVGYDHVVGRATQRAEELLESGVIGQIQTIDVEFREHWAGIFAAHPWLSGPADSYLGYWEKGGGASGEHSHAVNLWQHFAHVAGAGRVREVNATLRYVKNGSAEYDDIALFDLRTEAGLIGRVVQDVVTTPARKRARIQGTNGAVEWICGYDNRGDAVVLLRPGQPDEVSRIEKRRPDDFIWELQHIEATFSTGSASGIRLERGLDTMLVIAAAHHSDKVGRRVRIDYDQGYSRAALATAA
jgi:predicted dehydrogenase